MSKHRHHILGWLVLIACVGALLIVLWPMLSHHSAPKPSDLEGKDQRLTVLTWNTHQMGQFRKPAENEVLRYLLQQDADVICLQEVDVYKTPEFLTLPEVKQVLSAKYAFSYIDFAVYNQRRQFGNMVWSKYPLINKHTVEYEVRANISSRCDVVVEDDTIRLIVCHLESNRFDSSDMPQHDSTTYDNLRHSAEKLSRKWEKASVRRKSQAKIVRREIDQSPYPVIVVGDFNDVALSTTYRTISRDLHDAWLETSWFRWGATCELMGWGVRIDYILTDPSFVPIDCSVRSFSGSDHRPVVATIAW